MSIGDIIFGLVFFGGIFYVLKNSNSASRQVCDELHMGEKVYSIEPEHITQSYNIHYNDKI